MTPDGLLQRWRAAHGRRQGRSFLCRQPLLNYYFYIIFALKFLDKFFRQVI